MTHITCRLTAKNRYQFRNPTLGNRVWATFFTYLILSISAFVAYRITDYATVLYVLTFQQVLVRMIAYEIRRNHLIQATVRHDDKEILKTRSLLSAVSILWSALMRNSQIKSLTKISSFFRTGYESFRQISSPNFSSNPKSFKIKSDIFHKNKRINRFQ